MTSRGRTIEGLRRPLSIALVLVALVSVFAASAGTRPPSGTVSHATATADACPSPPPFPFANAVRRADYENGGTYRFTNTGVILAYYYAAGWYVNPTVAAQYTMALYAAWYGGDASALTPMAVNAQWLHDNAVERTAPQGGTYRTYEYPFPLDKFKAPAGWRSALATGQSIAALYAASCALTRPEFADRAQQMVLPFDMPVADGGYAFVFPNSQTRWFEEVAHPNAPRSAILNGHIYASAALDWYGRNANQPEAQRLAQQGIAAVALQLPLYDSNGVSLYDLLNRGRSCRYHLNAHIPQMQYLFDTTGNTVYGYYLEKWQKVGCVAAVNKKS